MDTLLEGVQGRLDAVLATIERLVNIDSPTTDRAGVNEVGGVVADQARRLGANVSIVPVERGDRGDHVVSRWLGGDGGEFAREGQLLVLVHLDTVWPLGEAARRPFAVRDGRAYGPAIYDMKASAAAILHAVEALHLLGRKPARPLTVLFTGDEEIGSWTSRAVIAEEASRSAAVLVLEGSENGRVVTARKGQLMFTVRALGRSAHAGMDHLSGVNAIEELAHHVLALQEMTDYEVGTTLSCGTIEGGTRPNVVPAEASMEVDVRVPDLAEQKRLITIAEGLQPRLRGARVQVETLVKRPPLVRDEGVARLYDLARTLGREFGVDLGETLSGGISDGNLTAAVTPTLDGLGPVGAGAHALDEHIEVDALPARVALLGRLIETI